MQFILFGFLYFLAFAAGCILTYLLLTQERDEAKSVPKAAAAQFGEPAHDERLRKQYDNLFRYNGTERGQMSIE